jgi:hypothetical protein
VRDKEPVQVKEDITGLSAAYLIENPCEHTPARERSDTPQTFMKGELSTHHLSIPAHAYNAAGLTLVP